MQYHQRKKPSVTIFTYLGAKQGWNCNHCREILPSTCEVDHIVPLWQHGSNDRQNLQILCPSCHSRKSQQETIQRFHPNENQSTNPKGSANLHSPFFPLPDLKRLSVSSSSTDTDLPKRFWSVERLNLNLKKLIGR